MAKDEAVRAGLVDREDDAQDQHDQEAGRDGGALKVAHLARVISEIGGRHVKARQATDAADDEVDQDRDIEAAAQA